jgi:RHS repeat-associated protein
MAGEKIRMYYDPRGQVIRTVNPDDTEQRVLYGVPNSLAVSLGEVDNPSPWESFTYDANDLDTSCDHYATPKSAEVDALGRTIKTIDRLESSNSTSNNVVMKYAYDIRGNLLLVQDAYDRDVFQHKYDLRSPSKEGESIPPLKTIHINKGTSIVVFDCAGKPAETRDAKGALTLHAYDGMQRPQYMWGRDNADENVTMRQCSVYGNDNSNNSIGKIYEHYDESGYERINYYDFKGNVLQKIKQVIADTEILQTIKDSKDGGWVTVGCYRVDWTDLNTGILSSTEYQSDMEYDALNRIKKITYPADASSNRKELIPSYNRAGALHHVEFDGNEYVKDIAYNAKGQRLLIAYGNGLMTRYSYNSKTFRLTRLKTEGYTYSGSDYEHTYAYNSGSTKQDFAYIYDKAGNILSITDATPDSGVGGSGSLERDFSYDALYRLLSGSGREYKPSDIFWNDTTRSDDPNGTTAYTQNYEYDLMGNINVLQHTGYNSFTREFTYHDNKLNSIDVGGNTFSFSYDDCGNQTQENSERLFEWDYADRMRLFYNQTSSGNEPSIYTHYLYDAGGNRVKKFTRTSGGNWQSTTYIDGIIEYTEDDSSNMGSISHIMDDSKRIANVREGYDFGDSTPTVKYNLDDHLGSSNVSVDDTGALVSFEEYYPFGETSFGSYGKKRYRFCGKEKDEESGLYYYGARYYSPWTCRFVSVDPKSLKYVHQSPFVYADNNPIGKIDHNGEGTGEGEGKSSSQPTQQPKTSQIPILELPTNKPVSTEVKLPATIKAINNLKTQVNNSIPIPPQKQTSIGPYNPQDYNEGYLKQSKSLAELQRKINEGQQLGQKLQPFLFGGGDMGYGTGKTLIEGMKQGLSIAALELTIGSVLSKIQTAKLLYNAKWTQTTYSASFSVDEGLLASKTIEDVTKMLKVGSLTPKDIPVDVIVRNGQTLIVNTRSSIALKNAGISYENWNVVNRTGQEWFEKTITQRLANNKLTEAGTNMIRMSNGKQILTW